MKTSVFSEISKLFKINGIGIILIAFAFGIILLLIPNNKKTSENNSPSSLEYANHLEDDLESLLKKAFGQNCKVMITFESGYSYSYASNDKLETISNENGVTTKNVSKEYVIIAQGGNESLVILKENLPKVKGVAIVCKKSTEYEKLSITALVSSLFDIPYESVGFFAEK